jgi:hypothetical protein
VYHLRSQVAELHKNIGHYSQSIIDLEHGAINNYSMLLDMVREVDLDRVEVPEGYEVLDASALGRRLGIKRETVLAYLSRRNFKNIPRPNRKLAMGPLWYEASVREWERSREGG